MMEPTWEDSKTLQNANHHDLAQATDMWGWPAYGFRVSASPRYVSSPPP
jgi:hypothetical protein